MSAFAPDRAGLQPSVLSLDRYVSSGRRLTRPGSGVRAGICVRVLKFRIHPAFAVLFLGTHHGPHLGELSGVRRFRLAAPEAGSHAQHGTGNLAPQPGYPVRRAATARTARNLDEAFHRRVLASKM